MRARASGLLLVVGACSGGGGGGPDAPAVDFDRRALLESVTGLVGASYQRFATESDELAVAIDAWCATPGAPERAAAQTAWREAIDVWQEAEAVLIGPAAMDSKALRDRIYAWPLASTCAVDQDVVARWAAPDTFDVATRLNNRRSLAAVEYLLFATTLAHTCPSQSAPPGWDTMSDADRLAARCGLAAAVADDVAAQADVVLAGWGPFADALVASGSQESVNVVSDSLFYVDSMTKDMKLGEAAGILVNSCATVQQPCVAEVEHRHADHGKQAIAINLRMLRGAFADGTSFDDFLVAVGAGELATRMVAELDDAIAAVEALDGTLLVALASDYPDVVAAHAKLKLFTDDLKSQFLTVLGLDIPDDIAADND